MKMLDLEALTDILREYPNCEATNEQFAEWLEEQEAVDIVHCYECKYYTSDSWILGKCNFFSDWSVQKVFLVIGDNFCSGGKRKEGEP